MLIQKLRLKRGWSQEQLAELSGLSVRTIQRVEQGKPASMESLKSLASVFEIDYSTLLEPSQTQEPSMNTAHTHDPFNGELPKEPVILPTRRELKQGNTQGLSPEEVLALRHVRKMKGFYSHLARYVLIVGLLAIINLYTRPERLWVLWVAFGWGIGLTFHALRTFVLTDFFGAEWEKKQVEKRLNRKI